MVIPPGAAEVAIDSDSVAPRDDHRRLGLIVAGVTLDGRAVPPDSASLRVGFHVVETHNGLSWRWTDGAALLVLQPSPEPRRLVVDVPDPGRRRPGGVARRFCAAMAR